MSKIENLKAKVLHVLETFPQSRDCDQWLTLKIWSLYYPKSIFRGEGGVQMVKLRDIMELPREDNVKRVRAIIQNVENKFLPTSLEVVRQRRINEELWKEYIQENK